MSRPLLYCTSSLARVQVKNHISIRGSRVLSDVLLHFSVSPSTLTRWRLLSVQLLQDGGDAVGSAVQGTGGGRLEQRRLGRGHLQLQAVQQELDDWRQEQRLRPGLLVDIGRSEVALDLCEVDLTGQGVFLQDADALGGLRGHHGGQLEVKVLLLGATQQGPGQTGQREQQSEEVGGRDAVKRFGAGAEVQSSLENAAHPLLVLAARGRDASGKETSTYNDLVQWWGGGGGGVLDTSLHLLHAVLCKRLMCSNWRYSVRKKQRHQVVTF